MDETYRIIEAEALVDQEFRRHYGNELQPLEID